MGGKDDELGLNLSLSLGSSSCPDKQNPPPPFPLNLMLSSSSFQNAPFKFNPPASQSSSDRNVVPQLNVGGIDVNLPAAITADGEEEMVVSSPNSTVSSVSHGKRSAEKEENEAEDDGGDAAERKKLRLSKEQSAMLEETFKEYNSLNQVKQKLDLAKELNLRPRQVEVWFQNRRARTKLKQTEVDCDYLRRCCEALTKENKRLQKEVSELRALKLSPQLYMNMSPPTTLTMCPQCERVVVSSCFSSAASACSSLPTLGIVNSGSHGSPVGPTVADPSRATHFPEPQHEDHRPRS